MVTIKDKMILINGKPELILCGEIHYFRLKKEKWQQAIDALKQTGCNAVASYIPWICHEYRQGEIDLTGKNREEHDLEGFIQLVEKNGLYFIPRPGPFIMAEMKNEGIPFWIFEKYPQIYPTTWDGKKAPNITCDYLNPDFLNCVDNWYRAVMELIGKHLIQNGGTTIAVQLDNEVGMLAWVSNSPDLTDCVLNLFVEWLNDKYGEEIANRYPFSLSDKTVAFAAFRSPSPGMALIYHRDLGHFMRERFKRYFAILKELANKYGVSGVPFIVNIHGSGGNRGTGYPIGISQLYESYNYSDDFISGSDYYIGNVDIGNFQDIYLANRFTDCVNSKNQPLTSMEFEAGDGNYGDSFETRYDPSAADQKTRMFIAAGNRLINYYLFSGGENYRFEDDRQDGNNRIAFTGQNHGFAAPLDPHTNPNTTYSITQDVTKLMSANSQSLATMEEEIDNIAFAFIPDYYMTEYHYPGAHKEIAMIEEIKKVRDRGYHGMLPKSLLLTNHSFKALDIQNNDILTAIGRDTTLVVSPCLYLDSAIQQNIVNFIKSGGSAFIYGRLPIYDMEGNPCTILIDFLGAKHKSLLAEKPHYYASVYPCGMGEGYPETRVYAAQTLEITEGEVFMRMYGSDEICGFTREVGSSRVVCLTNEYHCQLPLMKKLFEYAGIKNRLSNNCPMHGLFITTTINPQQERFVHILNVDGYEKNFDVFENGSKLFSETLHLGGHKSLMLPLNVNISEDLTVISSTAEIFNRSEKAILFRMTQPTDKIILKSAKGLKESNLFTSEKSGDTYTITIQSRHLDSAFVEVETP